MASYTTASGTNLTLPDEGTVFRDQGDNTGSTLLKVVGGAIQNLAPAQFVAHTDLRLPDGSIVKAGETTNQDIRRVGTPVDASYTGTYGAMTSAQDFYNQQQGSDAYGKLPTFNLADINTVLSQNNGKLPQGTFAQPLDQSIVGYKNPNGALQVPGATPPQVTPNGAPAAPGLTPVTLGNGQTVYYDKAGQAYDQKGTPVSNTTIASSTAPSSQPSNIPGTIEPPQGGGAPSLPNPTGASTSATYVTGLTATLDAQTKQLEDTLKAATESFQTRMDALTTQNTELKQLQGEGLLSEKSTIGQETADKQAALDLEKKQFQESYDAQKALIGRLTSLLTTGNQIVEDMKATTGLTSIMSPRIAQTMSDIQAEAGVITAAISAHQTLIGEAQNQLKSATDAITSIYHDQIAYWENVLSFYSDQQKQNNASISSLSGDQQTYIKAQISVLQDKVAQTQSTMTIVQRAMLDPTTALTFAKAGVTLNDSVAQMNQKLGTQGYAQELADLSEKMAGQGYSSSPVSGVAPISVTDSQGVRHSFYAATKPSTTITPGAGGTGGGGTLITSGKLTVTQGDIDTGAQGLKASASQGAEADGTYADPNVYLAMYKHWVGSGGKVADFFKYYPYATYINPKNTWLAQSITEANNTKSGGGAQTP